MGNITLQKDLAQQPVYFDGTVADSHNDYTYDALYRLIQAEGREHAGNNTAPTYNDSSRIGITPIPIASTDTAKMRRYIQYYEYDEVGNFTQMRHTVTGGIGNWTRYYTTETVSNKLLQTVIGSGTPESYQYDSRGNIINGLGHLQSMEYNVENRLEKVIIDNNRTAYYQYDGAGQRVRKTIINTTANKTEVRKYLGNWETYRRFVTSSLTVEIQRETLHISDDMGRMALVDTRTVGTGVEPAQLLRYQYSNHLSTATLELDETARIISYEEYHPYGSTSFQSGRSGAEVALKRYRYTGKERDEESGLYYHGARYYIPWLARWLSPDPINNENYNIDKGYGLEKNKERDFLELTASPYEYAYDNPIEFLDPTGEQASRSMVLARIGIRPPLRPYRSINRITPPPINNTRRGNFNRANSFGNITRPGSYNTGRGSTLGFPNFYTQPKVFVPYIQPINAYDSYKPTFGPLPQLKTKNTNPLSIPQSNSFPYISNDAKNHYEKEANRKIAYERLIAGNRGTFSPSELAEIARRLREGNATPNDKIINDQLRSQNEMYEVHPKHDPYNFNVKVTGASVVPDNHADIWDSRKENGMKDKKGNWWVAEGYGKNTIFHRFMTDNNGAFHWSGSTAPGMDKLVHSVEPIKKDRVPVDLTRKFKAN